MEGLQSEILVFLLYVALIYELVIAIKRRTSKPVSKEKIKFPASAKFQDNPRDGRSKKSSQDFVEPQSKSSRHFVQMRLLGRD